MVSFNLASAKKGFCSSLFRSKGTHYKFANSIMHEENNRDYISRSMNLLSDAPKKQTSSMLLFSTPLKSELSFNRV